MAPLDRSDSWEGAQKKKTVGMVPLAQPILVWSYTDLFPRPQYYHL